MKTIRTACTLQPNALEINVGDQIERLDEIIHQQDGKKFFKKTFITEGMRLLLSKGIARLAGKSNDSIFHLKQAMGGGKTHLMIGFALLANDPALRQTQIGSMLYQGEFKEAKVAAFIGRNRPPSYYWGEISRQLGKENLFREYWESGVKAPDEQAWLKLFEGDDPILILLDEMPPYFHYYNTQSIGNGTIADIVTNAFSNMLTAAQKKKNVCVVVSDLEAAYESGGGLIQRALDDATQELGRAEISITPVNLESNEIYEILRKRLFEELPSADVIADISAVYAARLEEAARAKTISRSAEAMASEIESTYPFHPSFKNIVALFKENEKFKQTRGLMELVSRLLKSVWESNTDIYLIGAQHFDLSINEVREKLAEISDMRDVIAKDLWDSTHSAHAQVIDLERGSDFAKQVGTLLLVSSLSTAVNSVRGLVESEVLEFMIDPHVPGSDIKSALEELQKVSWYLHQSQEGRIYFSHQENLTKKLQGYAEKAPKNKVDGLIQTRLTEMYAPKTKEAYSEVLPLPEIDYAEAILKTKRALLIISPDGQVPPSVVQKFFVEMVNKNNVLVLTGDRSTQASVENAARHVYAALKADGELAASHPQRKELDEKKVQYEQDFQITVLAVFDKLYFPHNRSGEDRLVSKALDTTYPSDEAFNGERQVIKTLTSDPKKLYTDIPANYDALKAKAEALLFGNLDDVRNTDLRDRLKQKTGMPWMPPRGFDQLLIEASQRGHWEDLQNGYITKNPKPKSTQVIISYEGNPTDDGSVRLTIDVANAGNQPKIHYAEDGDVSESSPVLTDNVLTTNSLRVQFLAVDPTGENLTGEAYTWENKLVLRTKLDETTRRVELFIAPRGNIRYTIDGSEPRNGTEYKGPIQIGKEAVTVYVFAECDGLETKRNFSFTESGSNEVVIKKDKPAVLSSAAPKVLDNAAKTYAGLKLAKEKNIEFENVVLIIGNSPKVINLATGGLKVSAEFIEGILTLVQSVFPPDVPVIMNFRKAHVPTGHDLEQFTKQLGIEINVGEVEQHE